MSPPLMSRLGTWDPDTDADPEVDLARVTHRNRQGRYLDFLLFALLPTSALQLRGLPVAELSMVVAVCFGILRTSRFSAPVWLKTLLPALFALYCLSAFLNDLSPYRRLLHVGLYVALAWMCAQGRFHIRAMARGLATGLLVSAGAFLVGYGAPYGGRLTGLMADPNAAGYMLVTLGSLALAGIASTQVRTIVAIGLLLALVLTYSRTSMLAALLIVVWLVIGRRLAATLGSIVLFGMIYAISSLPVSLQTFGPFADRLGSDALRARIVAQEETQIAAAAWYGNGPGTSQVDVLGQPFYFHNSYLALQNEGGRVAQVLLIGAGVFGLLGLLRLKVGLRNPWYEAALIAVAVCAVNLGEVLLELPAALALGLAAYHRSAALASDAAADASLEAPPPSASFR